MAQRVTRTKQLLEYILYRLLGRACVAKHAQRQRVHLATVAVHELTRRALVAA